MTRFYRVFGGVAVEVDERIQRVAGRQASVLALLIAANGAAVSRNRLVNELWSDDPPRDPEAALHNLVSRLRSLTGDDIETIGSSYRLNSSEIDLFTWENLLAEASSVSDYLAAEALWSGDPFAGLDDLPSIDTEVRRLEGVRRRARLARAELTLETSSPAEAAEVIRPLVTADPYDEEALGYLMRYLYLAGRKPESLREFQRYSNLLAEETGLEPSASIRELEVAILVDELETPEPESRTPARIDLSVRYIDLGEHREVAVGRSGRGDRIVIHPGWLSKLDLIASGLDMRSPTWAELAKTRELIFFDRLGTGLSRSDDGPLSFDESVEELKGVIRALDIGPVPVWAASGAGPIAVRAAAESPDLVSHLLLLGTYASGPDTFPRSVATSMTALVKASWGLGSRVLSNLLFPSASAEILEAWSTRSDEIASAETAATLLAAMYDVDVTPDLGQLSQPCLILHYRGDKGIPFRGAEQLARGIPGAEFFPLDGISHYPPHGEEERIARIVDRFLTVS